MALLRKSTGIYYIRRNGPGDYQLGTHRQAVSFLRQSPEKVLQETVEMRAAGLTVEAVDDRGGSLERGDAPPTPVDENVAWPSNWRIAATRGNNGKYYHTFYDPPSASTQTLTGSSPQDLVNRFSDLYHADPKVTRYLDSLPRVESAPIAKPAPDPVQTGPVLTLRPADQFITDADMSRLEAEREDRQQRTAKPPANLEFEEFYNTHSASESRKRAQQEPAFLSWIENHAATSFK